MENIRLFVDFGSTFTKVVAIDLSSVEVVATARVPSTVDTDITLGLEDALKQISTTVTITDLEKHEALACSSAAGGLRMVCAGFVPELTSKAANLAALGAGAKVVGSYSYKLTASEVLQISFYWLAAPMAVMNRPLFTTLVYLPAPDRLLKMSSSPVTKQLMTRLR
jgi:hypothetical protein